MSNPYRAAFVVVREGQAGPEFFERFLPITPQSKTAADPVFNRLLGYAMLFSTANVAGHFKMLLEGVSSGGETYRIRQVNLHLADI